MRRLFLGFAIGLYTLLFGGAACVAMLLIPNGNPLIWLARPWASCILFTSGVTVRVHGRERAARDAPAVYITNHQSHFDVLALVRALPGQYRIIAKKELFRIPVFGWALSLAGFIRIDRRDREQARRSLQVAARRMRSGRSVVVFAEGTRSEDGRLAPFKKGGFILAIDSGCPIVPVTLSGSRAVLSRSSLDIHRGSIDVVIGEPIPTRGATYESRDRLIALTRAALEAGYTPLHARDLAGTGHEDAAATGT